MGFDNECIQNIQSLPGEYFCPVCRTLIYPNESLQSQCTHLYCKPCLTYIVATTHACPYDGYLVTEADSKPLIESNKSLADTIGNVAVYCLYHRSGCQWQGTLSDCITHCAGCSFGNSPVVCNRCGTQIIHRQVQEHAQICPGLQPQAQQLENAQAQASTVQSQAVTQDTSSVASAAPASTISATSSAPASTASTTTATTISSATTTTTAAAAAPASAAVATPAVSSQGQTQTNATTYPQGTAQSLTPEQWYQQQQLQYQQYYQQYPGYDPYQQQYQQYGQYQQQFYQQYSQPQMPAAPQHATQGQQQQPSPYVLPQPHLQHHPQPQAQPQLQPQPQPQPQLQPQPQPQAQPQLQPQPQPQPQPQAQPQHQAVQPQPQLQQQHLPQPQQQHPQLQPHQHAQIPQVQAQQIHVPAQHPPHHPQTHPQTLPPPHAQVPGQQLGQVHPQPQHHPQVQPPQQHPGLQQSIPAQQHPQPQMQHPQTHPQPQPHPQPQSQAYPLAHSQPQFQQQPMQLQPHPQSHPNIQPQPQPVLQPQPQYPSARAVTGHQSYPQPQLLQQILPGAPQQRPMHMYPQQPVQMQNQFPSQQPPQMRPPHGHLSMPVQQPSAMHTPQGPHTNLHPQQQVHQHPGMRPQGPQQGLPPLQAQSHMQPSQTQQQGMPPPQHLMYPQQPVRPQGPPYVQQSFPAQPHSQQNLPQSQGLPTHPAQAVAGRPTMMVNHGMAQQSFQQSTGGPSKLVQPGMSHQSPSQSHMARSTALQQSQLPHTGIQSTLVPVSSALQPGISDKTGHAPELEAEMVSKIAEGTEGNKSDHALIGASESAELKIPNSKSASNEEEVIGEDKEDIQPGGDHKNIPESALVHGEGIESHAKDEKAEVPEIKLVKLAETTNLPDVGAESSHVPKATQGDRVQVLEGDPKEKSAQVDGRDTHLSLDAAEIVQSGPVSTDAGRREPLGSVSEKANQNIVSQGQISGGGASIQALQQVPVPGSLDRGQLQQSTCQNAISAHEMAFTQPGYHDRNQSQFTGQGPGSGALQGMPPSGLAPGQERFLQHIPYGHPSNMMDGAQRPPPPDKMLPHNIPHPGPIQERRFQEPPPHPMQVHGQTMAPSQIRPHGSNFPESLPHQGQRSTVPEPFQPPPGQQPYGHYHSEVPPAGPLVPGFPTSSARAPTHLGLPQKGFPEQAMTPQGQGQGPMLPPHAGVARISHGGLPPGVYDPANALEAEAYAARRPGFPDGRQPEPPFTHSSTMKANGIPGQGPPVGGMHDSKFSHVLAEDKFRPFTEDRFRSLPEDGSRAAQAERFRPSALDHGRSIVNRKEFEEDLKQFPRPAHLDGEGAPKFDGYVSSSRPLPGPDGGPSAPPSRPLLPYQSGGPFPAGSLGPEHHGMDIRERHRPAGFPEDLGRKHDPSLAHPDLRRSVPEFGRHRMDALPPLRSPGKEYSGLPSNRFGLGSQSSLEDFDGRDPRGFSERSKALGLPSDPAGSAYHDSKVPLPSAPGSGGLPSQFFKGVADGSGSHRMTEQLGAGYLTGTIRSSEAFGARMLPNLLRGGEHHGPSQMRMGEPAGFGGFGIPGRIRAGDPGFSSSYPVHGFSNEVGHLTSGEMDAFEFPRKRMPGSMGWCRICRIDCETVEGLDMHSQTREHQKMAMDMVLCIKQEIAKKQRISEVSMPLEDSSKSRKASFENRGNRQ